MKLVINQSIDYKYFQSLKTDEKPGETGMQKMSKSGFLNK